MQLFAQIALLSPPFSALEYRIPDWFPPNLAKPGLRVAVPLGKNSQPRSGFILSVSAESQLADSSKIKPVAWPLEKEPLINEELLNLSASLSTRQALQPGEVFGHTLPAGLRSCHITLYGEYNGKKTSYKLKELTRLPGSVKAEVLQALLNGSLSIREKSGEEASTGLWTLAADRPWPIRPAAKKQLAIMEYLEERGLCPQKELAKKFGSSVLAALQTLEKKKLVRQVKEEPAQKAAIPVYLPAPNAEQEKALDSLSESLKSGSAKCELLHGITGSGKTSVYLRLARECLKSGKSVFFLAPEVALAVRLYEITSAVLADFPVHLFHGYQGPSLRERIFRKLAASKSPAIVVGTRSSLFLPLHRPGLIILDEEHDTSFKQDEGFPYHAREAAWQRMLHNNGLLCLGSATPDIRTFHSARNGSIGLSSLKKRAGESALPPVRLVRLEGPKGIDIQNSLACASLLARESEQALEDCVSRGEQAIILLNRRGYAPLMYCPSCSTPARCPNCEIGLTYHKTANRLLCHYCGYTRPYPSPCPSCGHMNLLPLGEGTEKLEEKLETIARQPILRLDRDNTRRIGKMEEIMSSFARGEAPFLVGTQMISKGHHFPNVTLVVVADGDMGLNMPDYRASERSFQLLVQTAGRAGRGEKKGQVLIQTRNPFHYCWPFIENYDYEGFYKQELARRKKHLYPPFTRLALLRLSSNATLDEISRNLETLSETLKPLAKKLDVRLLGPAPAPIPCINGYRRFHFLLKSSRWDSIRAIYFQAMKESAAKIFKLFLDLDPVNMM